MTNWKSIIATAALVGCASAMPCQSGECSSMDTPLAAAPAPTPALPTAPEGSCTNGEFQCFGDHIIQCNLGSWVIWHCGAETSCVPNDFECVPADRWSAVSAQAASASLAMASAAAPATPSVFSAPTPAPAPVAPAGSCTNGEFQCYGDHVIQCNLGSWIIWPCASGTACVPNDFECVPQENWSAVYSQVNPISSALLGASSSECSETPVAEETSSADCSTTA